MKKINTYLNALVLFCMAVVSAQTTITIDGKSFLDLNKDGKLQPYEDTRLPQNQRVKDLMSRLTIEEKASLLVGTGLMGIDALAAINPVLESTLGYIVPGASGTTTPINKYGIPAIVMTDGPGGVRINVTRENSKQTYYSTGFPIAIALASTWDTKQLESIGKAIANETLEYGSNLQLAPGMNIMRNPLCGRNYEYYSEDPVVTGKLAAAMVNGLQDNGVAASPKHFAANNNEINRMSINVHASQRTLREIYLRPFEILVKEANPATIMSSYNLLNGKETSANYDLLTTILRDEWGFKGLVMTDWYGGYPGFVTLLSDPTGLSKHIEEGTATKQIKAGNDLLMPGLEAQKKELFRAIKENNLPIEVVDLSVKRILNMVFSSPKMNGITFSDKPDLKAHAAITREVASEGMVLLKNEAETLPFTTDIKKIAAFGVTSYDLISGGMGSGFVHRAYTISLLEGLKNVDLTIDKDLEKKYLPHLKKEQTRIAEKHKKQILPTAENLLEMPLNSKLITEKAKTQDIALITIGRNSGEQIDRKIKDDFNLTQEELNLIENVSKAFHAQGKKVVVILNIGGIVEVSGWQDKVDAVLMVWLPGQEAGNSIADILTGKANPSAKLPMSIPVKYSDISSASNFPGYPAENPTEIPYKEGIYVGYRYFDTFNIKPAYPFGYGLSYTQFGYSNIKISDKDFNNEIYVTVNVKNMGNTAGKEVVQLYLSAPKGSMDKPVKELKAFAKTKSLQPSETQSLTFRLTLKDLASFNPQESAWIADQGNYQIGIGASSMDIKQKGTFNLPARKVVEKVNNVLNNDDAFVDLKK